MKFFDPRYHNYREPDAQEAGALARYKQLPGWPASFDGLNIHQARSLVTRQQGQAAANHAGNGSRGRSGALGLTQVSRAHGNVRQKKRPRFPGAVISTRCAILAKTTQQIIRSTNYA